jgi:hypothetical protein
MGSAILTADTQPTPKASARTWQEQLSQIQKKLAEHTIGSDRDTHAVDHPVWIEEEHHGKNK